MVALSILLPISEDPSLSPVIDIETMNKAKRGREWPITIPYLRSGFTYSNLSRKSGPFVH